MKCYKTLLFLILIALPLYAQPPARISQPRPSYPVNCFQGQEASCDPTGIGTWTNPAATPSAWTAAIAACDGHPTGTTVSATYTYVGTSDSQNLYCPANGADLYSVLTASGLKAGDTIVLQAQGPSSATVYTRTANWGTGTSGSPQTCAYWPIDIPSNSDPCMFGLRGLYNPRSTALPNGKTTFIVTSHLANLPAQGTRISPIAIRQHLARLNTTGGAVIGAPPFADGWALVGLEMSSTNVSHNAQYVWQQGLISYLVHYAPNFWNAYRDLTFVTPDHFNETAVAGRSVLLSPQNEVLYGAQCVTTSANCVNTSNYTIQLGTGTTQTLDLTGHDTNWCDNVAVPCPAGYSSSWVTAGWGITINALPTITNITCPSQILSGTCQRARVSVTVTTDAYGSGTHLLFGRKTFPGQSPAHRLQVRTDALPVSGATQSGPNYNDWNDEAISVIGTGVPRITNYITNSVGLLPTGGACPKNDSAFVNTQFIPTDGCLFTGTITVANMTIGSGFSTGSIRSNGYPSIDLVYTPLYVQSYNPISSTQLQFTAYADQGYVNMVPSWQWLRFVNGDAHSTSTSTQYLSTSTHDHATIGSAQGGSGAFVYCDTPNIVSSESYQIQCTGIGTHWDSTTTVTPEVMNMQTSVGNQFATTPDLTASVVSVIDATHITIRVNGSSDYRVATEGPNRIGIYQSWAHGEDGIVNLPARFISTYSQAPFATANTNCPASAAGALTYDGVQLCPSAILDPNGKSFAYITAQTEQNMNNGLSLGGSNLAVVDSVVNQIHDHVSEDHAVQVSFGQGPMLLRNNQLSSPTEIVFTAGVSNRWNVPPQFIGNFAYIQNYMVKPDYNVVLFGIQALTYGTTPAQQENYTVTSNSSGAITTLAGGSVSGLPDCPEFWSIRNSTTGAYASTNASGFSLTCTYNASTKSIALSIRAGGANYGNAQTYNLYLSYGGWYDGAVIAGSRGIMFLPSGVQLDGAAHTWMHKNTFEYKSCRFCLAYGNLGYGNATVGDNQSQPGIAFIYQALQSQQDGPNPQGTQMAAVRDITLLSNWWDHINGGLTFNGQDEYCNKGMTVFDDFGCGPPESSIPPVYAGGAGKNCQSFIACGSYNNAVINNLITRSDAIVAQAIPPTSTSPSSPDFDLTDAPFINATYTGFQVSLATIFFAPSQWNLFSHNTFMGRPGITQQYNVDQQVTSGPNNKIGGTGDIWPTTGTSATWNNWVRDNVTACQPGGDDGGNGFSAHGLLSAIGCPNNGGGSIGSNCNVTGATDPNQRYTGNIFGQQAAYPICNYGTNNLDWTDNAGVAGVANASANYASPVAFQFRNTGTYSGQIVNGPGTMNPGDWTLTSPASGDCYNPTGTGGCTVSGSTGGYGKYATSDGSAHAGVDMAALVTALGSNVATCAAAPIIGTPSVSRGAVAEPYNVSIVVNCGTSPYTWQVASGSMTVCPTRTDGLCLNSGTGTISGTPTSATTLTFNLTVKDSLNNVSSAVSYSLVVNPQLAIVLSTLPTGDAGAAYSATVTSTGGVPPYLFTVNSGSMSDCSTSTTSNGLCMTSGSSGTASISGTPATAETQTFVLAVTDPGTPPVCGASNCGSFSIIINATLSITTPSLPPGTQGVPYTAFTMHNNGGTGPFTWSLDSTSVPLPTGMSFSTAGVLSGTPGSTTAGTYALVIDVTDSLGVVATAPYNLSIQSGGPPLTITTTTLADAVIGQPYNQQLNANGGTPPYTWSIAPTGALPPGLNIPASPGNAIQGRPTLIGVYSNVVLQVTDSASVVATSPPLTINVNPLKGFHSDDAAWKAITPPH